MNNNVFKAVVPVLVSLFFSCTKDIIVPDLSKETVNIISPPDSFMTTVVTLTFWWNELEDADKYNLQIVSPSFNNIQYLVVDTNVEATKFTITLNPGTYGWRVKAYNSGYSTLYTTYYLEIDSTSDLSQQVMVMIAPADNYVTKQMSLTFKWQNLYNASDYRFELSQPDFNGTTVGTPVITLADSAQYIFTSEGNFEWRVRGENDNSVTSYTTYSFEIDTTRPNVPTLVSPANNAVLSDSLIAFYWDRGIVTGSPISDSLYIYSDSLMSTAVLKFLTASTSYSDSLVPGKFFWRVRSADAAANKSAYSNLYKFTVQ